MEMRSNSHNANRLISSSIKHYQMWHKGHYSRIINKLVYLQKTKRSLLLLLNYDVIKLTTFLPVLYTTCVFSLQ